MEAGPAETRAQKAARIRPELFRLLLEFDSPEEEETEADRHLMRAKAAFQRQIRAEQEAAAAEAERGRVVAQFMHDRRPLCSGFRGTCRTTRDGGGLPEGKGIPAGITHDLVLQFDLPARRMEREERLLAMHGGDVNATLLDISEEGGGKDARFLLAHGAKANYHVRGGLDVLSRAARNGHLAVVGALLDAGADHLDDALVEAAEGDHRAVVALLLDRGADVHYAADLALDFAVLHGNLEMSTLHAAAWTGAPDTRPNFQETALEQARDRGYHDIAALLLARGAVDNAV